MNAESIVLSNGKTIDNVSSDVDEIYTYEVLGELIDTVAYLGAQPLVTYRRTPFQTDGRTVFAS